MKTSLYKKQLREKAAKVFSAIEQMSIEEFHAALDKPRNSWASSALEEMQPHFDVEHSHFSAEEQDKEYVKNISVIINISSQIWSVQSVGQRFDSKIDQNTFGYSAAREQDYSFDLERFSWVA
ncbi:MAG: hypothetical protein A2527_10405 [Candidatus Lambdaproteobacteria bacterium RIFOXYD2_FULL_50_16]|uniref:Uncharacterized protein n=1 Tax=Candidatus Lambdaproteobacteria bacterium RIFOXYD2_FULL_50_16 TaxID=1817772 RepID=A0A1F6GGJ0_9PROT|nr:MAG: hypothetical protein A2527_10405 [Candidatus Lambdaproteobacteria bacterium RIFOXYD2_FULL_50_16]